MYHQRYEKLERPTQIGNTSPPPPPQNTGTYYAQFNESIHLAHTLSFLCPAILV